MALAKKYYANYQSSNGWDYYIEIWAEGATTSSEILLGDDGATISYDTDEEHRFSPILASTLNLPIVIEEAGALENFVLSLRDTYEEQEVYIHLFQSTGRGNAIWSGFVLMDLADYQDQYYPYVVNVKATDGIALLKDKDFVETGATRPYDSADMYWGPGTFVYWLAQILQKTGYATTADGAVADPKISTSVDWYNAEHAAVSQANDPLALTKGKMGWTHYPDENREYQPMNCYDVLKAILRAWGCRIVYWQTTFYIVQLPEYNETETGTLAAPVNVPTRGYSITGALVADRAHLGTLDYSRYSLDIEFTTPTGGLQKLKGTKYTFLPRLKEVNANFISGGGTNHYGGFPHYDGTTFTGTIAQQTITDAHFATNLYLQIPIKVQHSDFGTIDYRWFFDVKATNGVTTKWLWNTANVLSWESTQPTAYPVPKMPEATFSLTGIVPREKLIFDRVLPTDAAFDGAWDFEIIMDDSDWGSTTQSEFLASNPAQGYHGVFAYTPATTGARWSNIPANNFGYTTTIHQSGAVSYTSQTGAPFDGEFMTLNSNIGVNQFGQNVIVQTNTSDTDIERIGETQWGDTFDGTDDGSLLVYTGSAWVETEFTGEWGKGTLSGTSSFTELLVNQFIKGQTTDVYVINGRLVVGAQNKNDTLSGVDYPKYINPVGLITENPSVEASRRFVFKRGKFNTLMDEWAYEGWAISVSTPTTTDSDIVLRHVDLPVLDNSGGPAPRLANPHSDPTILSRNAAITDTSAAITGTLTSIPINAIGAALLVAGDKIVLLNRYGIDTHELEVNATQASDAVTITIVSYDFGAATIPTGALIVHNKLDLIQQYQNKTSGTIGGMTVTADSIDGAKSIGRQQIFFRCDGSGLSEAVYYVLNGEDNNKSGRFAVDNTTAPTTISTQRAIKSCQFVCDGDYKIESGTSIMTGTNGWDVEMQLYKTTPVDGTVGNTAMTLIGQFDVSLALDSRTQITSLTSISGATISDGDIIIPHIIAPIKGPSSTYNFRAGITFTLIRE